MLKPHFPCQNLLCFHQTPFTTDSVLNFSTLQKYANRLFEQQGIFFLTVMQNFYIEDKHDLICPICYAPGPCPKHLVEMWVTGERPNHFDTIAQSCKVSKKKWKDVFTRYPTPESHVDSAICVSWEVIDPDADLMSLSARRKKRQKNQEPEKAEYALFHQEGVQLLEMYRQFLITQLQRDKHIHRVLQALGGDKPKRNYQLNFLNPSASEPPIAVANTTMPFIEDPDSLIDDIMQNLI